MDDSRRKLPSWMLGMKKNENIDYTCENNGAQKEEGSGKLVKACREGKRVSEKRRKRGGDDDEFEQESSEEGNGCDGGDRRVRKGNGDYGGVGGNGKLVKACREGKRVIEKRRRRGGDDDEVERVSSEDDNGCDGGDRRIRKKGDGDYGCVEGNDESREGKDRGRGSGDNVEGGIGNDVVDDGVGYGKRKDRARVRKEKLGSDGYVDVYGDGDDGVLGEKRKKGGRKRKGKGKIDVAESKKLELEEDEVEDDDGGGAQVVMRNCKGTQRGGRGKLVHSKDLVDVRGTLAIISDDEDLTVEDLVSIAEEYVNKDMEAAHHLFPPHAVSSFDNLARITKEHTVEREEIGGNHTCETSINDNTQSGGSPSIKLFNREEARSDSLLNENVTVLKPIMSGDPAQDMLDLFLGHLLKRPQEEEKKFDMSLAVQRQEPVDPPVDGVPLTKKKSSLKDKVAMFFD